MTAVLTQISLTQLQFTGSDDTANKLRRLVTELVNAEKAINALIGLANDTTDTPTTVPKHVLADTTGLGASHTTSGLKVGQVLRAVSATNAAFQQLKFSDLAQSDIQNPEQGNIIVFEGGYWVAGDISNVTGSKGENLGEGTPVYVDNDGNTLRFRTLAEGVAVQLTLAAEQITISVLKYSESEPGIVPAPGTNDHSQMLFDDGWAVLSQVHVYFGSGAPTSIENDGDFYFDASTVPYTPYVQDAGVWEAFGGGLTVTNGTLTVATTELLIGAGLTLTNPSAGVAQLTSSGGGGGAGAGFTQIRGGTFTAGASVLSSPPDIPLIIPQDCTISKVVLLTEGGNGSCVIDIFKAAFGGTYPPTASICASDLPTITAGTTYSDTALTGWTTALSADDVLLLHVDSTSTFKSIGVFLYLQIPQPLIARGATFTGGALAIITPLPDVTIIIPEACTIEKVVLLTEGGTGSCVVDILKSAFGAYPPTASICASDKPTISSGVTYEDTTLTGWTTALNANDVLGFHLVSASTFKTISITLYLRPT